MSKLTVSDLKLLANLISGASETPCDQEPTCNQVKLRPEFDPNAAFPWKLGAIYLVRTVTMIDTGRLVAVTDKELVLEDAAWIPDTGRFSDAVAKAEYNEVEPFPDGQVIIGRGAVIDAVIIPSVSRTVK